MKSVIYFEYYSNAKKDYASFVFFHCLELVHLSYTEQVSDSDGYFA